jgi:hypothetical protein
MKASVKSFFFSFVTVFVMTISVKATPSLGLQALSKGIAVAKTSSSVFNFFRAERRQSTVNMSWAVSNAQDISFFVVQKSTDGENFENLGELFSDGVTPLLTYEDAAPQTGSAYYRVVAILYDGNIDYSDIRRVRAARRRHHCEY